MKYMENKIYTVDLVNKRITNEKAESSLVNICVAVALTKLQ